MLADADGKRLFIADTGHNRIIQTDLEGEDPVTIGSGEEGFDDGDFKKATFNRPQGMFLSEDTLFVADTENHAIRAVDLKDRQCIDDRGHRQTGPRSSRPDRPGRPRQPRFAAPGT